MSNEQYAFEGSRVIALRNSDLDKLRDSFKTKSGTEIEITPETVVREEEVAPIQTENVAPVIPNEPEAEAKNAELTQSEVVEQPVVSPVVNEPVMESAVALDQNTEMNIPAYEQSNVSENTVVNAEPVQSEMPTDGNVFDAPVMREQQVQMNGDVVVGNEQKQAGIEYANASTFYIKFNEVQKMCEEINETIEALDSEYEKLLAKCKQLEIDNAELLRTIEGMTNTSSMGRSM